ncbi:hypothetical protein CASFOL_017962 [Castilleja foliolosa]|uniref:Uncharacterized protein n=1 Tax=Castilleja foliolosa TaxID=1961234 RepID=A0ABD3DCA9_9LAMI
MAMLGGRGNEQISSFLPPTMDSDSIFYNQLGLFLTQTGYTTDNFGGLSARSVRYDSICLQVCRLKILYTLRELKNSKPSQMKPSKVVDLYTQAIELKEDNAVYWANRAFAHTKLEEYGIAIQDATKAIEIDPKYSKAWLLQAGCSILGMGKFIEALKDFQQVKRRSVIDSIDYHTLALNVRFEALQSEACKKLLQRSGRAPDNFQASCS